MCKRDNERTIAELRRQLASAEQANRVSADLLAQATARIKELEFVMEHMEYGA